MRNLRGLEKTGASASDLHTVLLFVWLHVSAIFSWIIGGRSVKMTLPDQHWDLQTFRGKANFSVIFYNKSQNWTSLRDLTTFSSFWGLSHQFRASYTRMLNTSHPWFICLLTAFSPHFHPWAHFLYSFHSLLFLYLKDSFFSLFLDVTVLHI